MLGRQHGARTVLGVEGTPRSLVLYDTSRAGTFSFVCADTLEGVAVVLVWADTPEDVVVCVEC